MKFLWFVLLVATLLETKVAENIDYGDTVWPRVNNLLKSGHSDEINQVLSKLLLTFQKLMKTGDKLLGIPVLDPLIIDKTFDIHNKNLLLNGEFYAEVLNLSNYSIETAYVDMNLNTIFNVSMYNVSMKGYYSLNGKAMDIVPIMGAGNHQLSFNTLNLFLQPQFEAKNGYLKLLDSGFTFEEKDLEVFIEGLLEDAQLSNLLAYFLKDSFSSLFAHSTQLAKVLDTKIVKSFNDDDGKGQDIYDLIETVKSLAGW